MAHWGGGQSDAGGRQCRPGLHPRRDRGWNEPPAVQGWPTRIRPDIGGRNGRAAGAGAGLFRGPDSPTTQGGGGLGDKRANLGGEAGAGEFYVARKKLRSMENYFPQYVKIDEPHLRQGFGGRAAIPRKGGGAIQNYELRMMNEKLWGGISNIQ